MKRESHVQFCERPGVQFLRPTHRLILSTHFSQETNGPETRLPSVSIAYQPDPHVRFVFIDELGNGNRPVGPSRGFLMFCCLCVRMLHEFSSC